MTIPTEIEELQNDIDRMCKVEKKIVKKYIRKELFELATLQMELQTYIERLLHIKNSMETREIEECKDNLNEQKEFVKEYIDEGFFQLANLELIKCIELQADIESLQVKNSSKL